MVTYFNKKDMISFGEYLLSEERREDFENLARERSIHGMDNPLPVDESLAIVHHADFENWKHSQKNSKS
jgi:hypothetical protein